MESAPSGFCRSVQAFRVLRALGWGVYGVLWVGGALSYAVWEGPPDHLSGSGVVFITLGAALMAAHATRRWALALALAGLLGWVAEVCGVHTGVPFGAYTYTRAFAPLAFGVPVVMAPAWIVLCGYTVAALRPVLPGRAALVIVGAAHLTAIDLVLDPVAAGPLGLWAWERPGAYYGIPVSNYVGWYATGVLALTVLLVVGGNEPVPRRYWYAAGAVVVAFFTVLALSYGFLLAGGAGMTLLGVDAFLAVRAWRRSAAVPSS